MKFRIAHPEKAGKKARPPLKKKREGVKRKRSVTVKWS